MERLQSRRKSGISRNGLRTWGMLLLAVGIFSRSILQIRLLGLGSISGNQLLAVMESSETAMMYATVALVMEVLSTCAIPIFAFMLAEGVRNTGNLTSYALRVAKVALVSEIPYNLAMTGKLMNLTAQNPVFALLLALILIAFFQRYSEKKSGNVLIRIVLTLAAVAWCGMLRIENGAVLLLTVLVLWLFWEKPLVRNIAGASVVLLCSVVSLFLMAAPMAFLAIHSYNGEKGEENRTLNYLIYPAMLTVAAVAGLFLG